MSVAPRKKHKRGVFDVHDAARATGLGKLIHYFKHPRVINLTPKFRERHPILTAVGVVLFSGLLIFGARKMLTRAEVVDFYPTTCLGTWQDPQQAQGIPETFNSSEPVVFSRENSAVFPPDGGEIFCGGFVLPDYENKGAIKNVGLTFAWHMEGVPEPGVSVLVGAEDDPLSGEFIFSVDEQEASNTPSSVQLESFSEEIPSPTEEPAALPPSDEEPSADAPEELPPPPAEEEPTGFLFFKPLALFTPGVVRAQEAPAEAPATEAEDAPVPVADPPAEEIPAPVELAPVPTDDPPENPPTFSEQAPASEADESPSAVPSESSTEDVVIIGPPIEASLEFLEETESLSESIVAGTEVVVPPEPDDAFLAIEYSTDGNIWFSIQKVYPENWRNLTVALPINTWEDAKKLQVRVRGIPTVVTPIPKVYLDGMFIEVHYDLLPLGEEEAKNVASDEVKNEPRKIFDEGAKHSCSIEPFVRTVEPGKSVAYSVLQKPSGAGATSRLDTGELPTGVSAAFSDSSGQSASAILTLRAENGAPPGSFNVIVIYEEIDQSLNIMTNFCQLNLIIE